MNSASETVQPHAKATLASQAEAHAGDNRGAALFLSFDRQIQWIVAARL